MRAFKSPTVWRKTLETVWDIEARMIPKLTPQMADWSFFSSVNGQVTDGGRSGQVTFNCGRLESFKHLNSIMFPLSGSGRQVGQRPDRHS